MVQINLAKAMAELDEGLVVKGVRAQLLSGVSTIEIVDQLLQGIEQVGKLYKVGDYFLSELIISSDIYSTAAGI